MFKQLIINSEKHETRVALLEDGHLAELFVEQNDDTDITGNIYKGKVVRVLPGMQAAFVDIGLDRAAFIYVDDLWVNVNEYILEDIEFSPPAVRGSDPIEDLITEGQQIMVQVAKSPIGSKGARVTSFVALPGRYLVLTPGSRHIGVSRRIESESERERLKNIVRSHSRNGFNYIVRTAAEGIDGDDISREVNWLNAQWEEIQRKHRCVSAPHLLHRELPVALRAVRDYMMRDVHRLTIDSPAVYGRVIEFLDRYLPERKNVVENYAGFEPIFDYFQVEQEIERALKLKVWLKSGGYIIIEHTEALVSIDVNTGRYVGKSNLEETILKTNIEAVKEIARQIRLRDISGIIIIDLIDMDNKSNRQIVLETLTNALKHDRSKNRILPISELGLIQMTRKRVRKPLDQVLCEPCFYCGGKGFLLSSRTICHKINREAVRAAKDMSGSRLCIQVHAQVAEAFRGPQRSLLESLERFVGKPIEIQVVSDCHLEEFDIVEIF
jgi:ribonuclease G